MKEIGIAFTAIVMLVGISFGVFELNKYFNPKYEALRYEVQKESQSYRDGMTRRLRNLQMEYNKASPEHKSVIASTILHESSSIPDDKLPYDLRQFISTLRRQ